MRITKRVEFDAAHRVPWHESKCRHLHGHRYAVEATIEGPVAGNEEGSESGMVMDFGRIKEALTVYAEQLDHSLLLWKDDPAYSELMSIAGKYDWAVNVLSDVPTAENIAREFADGLRRMIDSEVVVVVGVTVYETPTSWATWKREKEI